MAYTGKFTVTFEYEIPEKNFLAKKFLKQSKKRQIEAMQGTVINVAKIQEILDEKCKVNGKFAENCVRIYVSETQETA